MILIILLLAEQNISLGHLVLTIVNEQNNINQNMTDTEVNGHHMEKKLYLHFFHIRLNYDNLMEYFDALYCRHL